MNKALAIVGSAVLAAAMTTLVPMAQAGGKGFRMGGGFLFGHHHHHRRIIVTPVYTETYRAVRKPVIQEKVAAVRYADGMGRVYDLASKSWYDGVNRCWSGKLPWTFKNGSWFYGSYGWSEAGGAWRTNAPEAPAEIDCGTVQAFAGKFAPTVSQSSGQKEMIGSPDQGGQPKAAPKPLTPPVKTAEKGSEAPATAATAGECKKYVPSLGEMLPVPCTM